MFEAIFVSRSVQFHKDMRYHVIDEDNNYSAASIELLVEKMSLDGSLFGGSDDDYSNSFSVTFLNDRIIVGVGILIDKDVFRILFKDGSIQDYS
jgi:hypothetical protein